MIISEKLGIIVGLFCFTYLCTMRWWLFLLLASSVAFGQVLIEKDLCNGDVQIELSPEQSVVIADYYPSVADGTRVDTRFLYSIASSGTYTIEYKLTNQFGCVAYGVATILVDDCPYWSFYVPNAFTPNEDIYNNTWFPKYENVYIKTLEIYNRWGELIYNKVEPWDGLNAQDDVYAYRIIYIANNVAYESIGRVSIIR